MRPEGLSMKNSNATIGHRTGDLSACSTLSQPSALLQSAVESLGIYSWFAIQLAFLMRKIKNE